MPNDYPGYKLFTENIWSNLDDEEKNILFFWSLWSYGYWEEGRSDFLPDWEKGKKEVFEIIKGYNKEVSDIVREKGDIFYRKFVFGEFLSNYILAYELIEKLKEKDQGWKIKPEEIQSKKTSFPDITLREDSYGTKVNIEIKGGHSGSSIPKELNEKIKPNLDKKDKGYTNFLLLFLFPECFSKEHSYQDHSYRINQLIKGFYVCEDMIAEEDNLISEGKINGEVEQKKRKVLCRYIEKEAEDNNFSLDSITNDVFEKYFCYIRR